VWKRAGMNGHVVGLDLAEAMTSLPPTLDLGLARRLFLIAERTFVPAWWRQARENRGSGTE
jgi:hypothetical protein